MTLQQLRYVIQAADSRSMNEAAKALYISQPSLSGAIKELEKEIGIELFKRSSHGTVLTPEGEEFWATPVRLPISISFSKTAMFTARKARKIQCVDAALQLCREGIRGAGETVRHG